VIEGCGVVCVFGGFYIGHVGLYLGNLEARRSS
jgi:hypothetical protein